MLETIESAVTDDEALVDFNVSLIISRLFLSGNKTMNQVISQTLKITIYKPDVQ